MATREGRFVGGGEVLVVEQVLGLSRQRHSGAAWRVPLGRPLRCYKFALCFPRAQLLATL